MVVGKLLPRPAPQWEKPAFRVRVLVLQAKRGQCGQTPRLDVLPVTWAEPAPQLHEL